MARRPLTLEVPPDGPSQPGGMNAGSGGEVRGVARSHTSFMKALWSDMPGATDLRHDSRELPSVVRRYAEPRRCPPALPPRAPSG